MNKRLILLPLQARFLSEHFSDFLAKYYIPEGTPDAGIGAVLPGPSIPSSGKKKKIIDKLSFFYLEAHIHA